MEFVLGWNVSRHSMNWLVETFSWAPEEFSTWMRRGTNSKEVLKGKTILAPVIWLRSVKNGGVCFIARYVEGIMLPQIFGPKELAIDTPEFLLWSQSSHHHTSPILAMRWLRLIRMAWTRCFMSSAVLERRHLDIVAPYDPRPTGPLRSTEWSMNFQWSNLSRAAQHKRWLSIGPVSCSPLTWGNGDERLREPWHNVSECRRSYTLSGNSRVSQVWRSVARGAQYHPLSESRFFGLEMSQPCQNYSRPPTATKPFFHPFHTVWVRCGSFQGKVKPLIYCRLATA